MTETYANVRLQFATTAIPLADLDRILWATSTEYANFNAMWPPGQFLSQAALARVHLAALRSWNSKPVRVLLACEPYPVAVVRRVMHSRGMTGWFRRGSRRPL